MGWRDEKTPEANSTENRVERDVLGNKEDTGVQDASTTASIIAYLKGLMDMIDGTTGLTTFPAAAKAANGVSLAEVLRHAQEAVGTNDADNTFTSAAVAANADGSVLERLEYIQASGTGSLLDQLSGDTGIASFPAGAKAANGVSIAEVLRFIQEAIRNGTGGTAMGENKSVCDALGTDGVTVNDTAVSVLGAIGADNANNAFASTAIAPNEDGSVLERLEQIQEAVNSGAGTSIAANKSLVDVLGSDGNAVTDSAVSVLGAIGADNADNAFASTNVVSNADGSVLERLEYLQANKLDATGIGTVFSVTKAITQSAIVAAGVDLTGVSSGGALELIGVYIQNGATAFDSGADGAVLEMVTNNVSGSVSFLTAAQAKLTANSIVTGANATSWLGGVVLETGKKVTVKATTEDFTSAGSTDFVLIFRRLAAGATIAAAA